MNGRTFNVRPITSLFGRDPLAVRGLGGAVRDKGAMIRTLPAAITSGRSVAPGLEIPLTICYRM